MANRIGLCTGTVSLLTVLSVAVEAQHPRPGNHWAVQPIVHGSWTVQECLRTYRAHRNILPYRHDLDYCFVHGQMIYVPHVIRGVLRQAAPWQPPPARLKLDEWRHCLQTYREVGDPFRCTNICVEGRTNLARSSACRHRRMVQSVRPVDLASLGF